MKSTIELAATQLREAATKFIPCQPVRFLIGDKKVDIAYSVQKMNTNYYVERGSSIVGCKIGSTSIAVQKQFGILHPDFGVLFKEGRIENGGEISIRNIMQPKVEGEIAFVLATDIDKMPEKDTHLETYISHALVSIELLGSRIQNWDITLIDTIADNASASHFVLGNQPSKVEAIDLINCKMKMERNGKIVSEGKGADSLGSPINSLRWLAETMIRFGSPLRAGNIILTGALGPVSDACAGDYFSVAITGLGEASVRFVE